MRREFGKYNEVQVSKGDKGIRVTCSCDFRDLRKEQFYLNEKNFAVQVQSLWDQLKKASTLIQGLVVHFEEIDWYDSDVDCYDVPYFSIKRGLRKVKIGHDRTGTVPKAWQLHVVVTIKDTRTIKPIMAVIDNCMRLSTKEEKDLQKEIRKVLKGEESNMYVSMSDD
jgi:hypothetical protein